ncbi:MAG TPA: hypothetical protein DCE71_04650, partial [Parachlamydiales bacterium]|nr:hypothetical protein [Parachlamydiales bacterium]
KEGALSSAEDFFYSSAPIAPQLTFEQQVKIQQLLERFKEDALGDGVDESGVESFVTNRLIKEMGRAEKIRREREEKLLQANQEIASEPSEIVKKSPSRVQFAKQFTVRKFHNQTKDWVGFAEQRDVDTVRTRECYITNYSVDYKKSLRMLEEGTREIGSMFSPHDDCLQTEPVPPSIEDTRLLNYLADVSTFYFSSLDRDLSTTPVSPSNPDADKKAEKEEEKIEIAKTNKRMKRQMSFNAFDLEFVEGIIKKLKAKDSLTSYENTLVKKLRNLDRIYFEQKKPKAELSSFMKRAEKTDRYNREKSCREYFQQHKS